MTFRHRAIALVACTALPGALRSQQQRDSLRLSALHAAALQTDPRQRQLALQSTQSELRLRNLAAERMPTLTVEGLAQYQSDVVTVPAPTLPGQSRINPPHDTYDARLVVRESLFDPSLTPRRAVERATLVESQAQVRATLFTLRQEVDEAFFSATLLDARSAELRAAVADLQGRRREAVIRVREGAALPGDTSSLDAAILQRSEDILELRANRAASIARLGRLVGRAIDDSVAMALPDLAVAVRQARSAIDSTRARPEYAQFGATRDRIASQSEMLAARVKPVVSTFARLGYGKPGLDFLSNSFETYWIAGVQLQWTPITWGALEREREALSLQQQIVSAGEAAFTAGLRRAVEADLHTIDRLEAALATDDRIVALREQVERETRIRLQEGVVTSADYVTRSSELLQARLTRATHRVSLAQARAHFLTTLGMEVR
jgi:outer membrane protein TolC